MILRYMNVVELARFQLNLRYMNVVELARFQLNLRYSTVQVLPGYPVGVKSYSQLVHRYRIVCKFCRVYAEFM